MNVDDREIYNLAREFRGNIVRAKKADVLQQKCCFRNFPNDRCREASYLLAEFLRVKGIETLYVWGDDEEDQSHGWLVLSDERVKEPTKRFADISDVKDWLNLYGNESHGNIIYTTRYEEDDIEDGLIIDITADQFGKAPVYVGYMDNLHKKFEFRAAERYGGLGDDDSIYLYNRIMQTGKS